MRLTGEGIAARRGALVLFEDVSFSLEAGGCLVVTGPNGAGKSTLLRIVAGLLPALAGTVRLEAAGEAFPTVASAAHYLGHRDGMKASMTVLENLAFWRDFLGEGRLAPAEALEAVGLGAVADLPFAVLSAGQRRRSALARLLVSHRPLWILDEPTAGLDAASDAMAGRLIAAHLAGGGLAIAATHQPLAVEGAQRLDLGALA